MFTLEGKTAVITGAGNGLGFEYAKSMAALGATVGINDLGGTFSGEGADAGAAGKAVKAIEAAGGVAFANAGDVTSEKDAEEMINQAFDRTGHLDILVCNAGILRDSMVFNMDPKDWDAVVNVHLRGHFLPLHYASKKWRENFKKTNEAKPASVILTSSRSGLYSNAGQLSYAAAKAGIASMAMVLARELGKYGVRTNAIAPIAKTRMTESSFGKIDAGKWDPANVAPMVSFLASDEASDINGQVFVVGGGQIEWMRGWTPQGAIDSAGGTLSPERIVELKGDLFGDGATSPEAYPTAQWA